MTTSPAEIFDLGYRGYEGERTSRWRRRLAIWRDGVRISLGLGRGAGAKFASWLLICLALVPMVVLVLAPLHGLEEVVERREQAEHRAEKEEDRLGPELGIYPTAPAQAQQHRRRHARPDPDVRRRLSERPRPVPPGPAVRRTGLFGGRAHWNGGGEATTAPRVRQARSAAGAARMLWRDKHLAWLTVAAARRWSQAPPATPGARACPAPGRGPRVQRRATPRTPGPRTGS